MEQSSTPTSALVKVTSVTDWSGPRDPENPYNWRRAKKIYHTAIPSAFAFVVSVSPSAQRSKFIIAYMYLYRTIASSIYVSAIEDVRRQFHVSLTVALLPYSFYVFGQAWGPVLAAPMSETFGRRGTYAPYMLLFALFTLCAGSSQNIASIIICRFFAGLFGSPALSVSAGTVADIWMPQDRAIPMAVLVFVPFLGPSLG
jgi:MFS family permease